MKTFRPTRLAMMLSMSTLLAMGAAHAAQQIDDDDREFLEKAALSGQLEIEASKLAQQRATHPEVKQFADMMVQDHTAMDKSLKELASRKGVELPAEIHKDVQDKLDDLADEKPGKDFDEEYAEKIAVDAHEDAVELFEDASKDAKDEEIKAFAAQGLPKLQTHLEQGKALKKTVDDHDYDSRAAAANPPASAGTSNNAPGAGPTSPAEPAMPASNDGTPSTNPTEPTSTSTGPR
ncbi:DUF4142 domain-containing protein [Orrella sp. JC864]|uniref:DUF4142 domain-containing protein n=1 Tax=Orrella sp. JC864 TaxID=3120298 RepID=UPI00300B5E5A